MIQPNELRIGNYIKPPNGNAFRVDEIVFVNGRYAARMYIDWESLSYAELYLKSAEPIPLTEEILQKYGIEKTLHTTEIHGLFINACISVSRIEEEYIDIKPPSFFNELPKEEMTRDFLYKKRIEYLHQYQNLYFLLTGEELEVKL